MSEWKELINSMGFPIAAFLLMFWLVNATIKENTKALTHIQETLAMLCAKTDKCDK